MMLEISSEWRSQMELLHERIVQKEVGKNNFETKTVKSIVHGEADGLREFDPALEDMHYKSDTGVMCGSCGCRIRAGVMNIPAWTNNWTYWSSHPNRCNFALK